MARVFQQTANQDLPWLGFIAEPRGYVGHGPYGGIVEAPLEADGAERSEAVRYADAEANVVPKAAPGRRQSSDGVTHLKGHDKASFPCRASGACASSSVLIPNVSSETAELSLLRRSMPI